MRSSIGDLLKILFMIACVVLVYVYKDNISNFLLDVVIYKNSDKVLSYNEYYLNNDFLYFENVETNKATSNKELLNILYSIINSGDDSYSFYCDYDKCIDDITFLINDKKMISTLNNFVHPYNSFSYVNIDIKANKKITLKVKKLYTDEQIEYINNYIQNFISENITDNLSIKDKIKLFHDYIINNTYYDDSNNNESHNAYNLITEGKGICGAYSDIMSIYLNYLGIKNYKISSENHVWNFVNVDNNWYHIDVTWDDPVASDGNQYLVHNFFMITTDELFKLDKVEHNFDLNIYLEAKEQ